MLTLTSRCGKCHTRCHQVVEELTRTSSRCVLVEANKYTRKASKDEHDARIKIWANAVPPVFKDLDAQYDAFRLEVVNAIVKGKVVLDEDHEFTSMDLNEEGPSVTSDDESANNSDCGDSF